jgi:hypothetical protein
MCLIMAERALLETKEKKNEEFSYKKSFDAIYGYPRSVDLVHENKRVAFNGSFKKGKED